MNERRKENKRYTKYKINYIKAFDRMINKRIKRGLKVNDLWKDGESVYKWWTEGYKNKKNDTTIQHQLALDIIGNGGLV